MGTQVDNEKEQVAAAAAATQTDAATATVAAGTKGDTADDTAASTASAAADDTKLDAAGKDKSDKSSKNDKDAATPPKTVDLVAARREHQRQVKETEATQREQQREQQKQKATQTQSQLQSQQQKKGEGRTAELAADDKSGTAAGPATDAGAAAGAEAKSDLKGQDDKKSAGEFDVSKIDFKAGWFDRLTKEQQAWLSAKRPDIVEPINAAKTEATRYVEAAKKKAAMIADPDAAAATGQDRAAATKPASTASAAAASTTSEEDLAEAIDLLYDPKTKAEGLRRLFTDSAAAPIIKQMVAAETKEILKSIGVDIDQQIATQPLAAAIVMAAQKYPQLIEEDGTFFEEVDDLLREDMETYEALVSEKNPRLVAAAIREASATVVRSRAAKKATEEKPVVADTATTTATATQMQTQTQEKKPIAATTSTSPNVGTRRDNLLRNTQAANDAAGVKAGSGKRPGAGTASGQDSGVEGKTADLVRNIRQQKDYQHLRGTT